MINELLNRYIDQNEMLCVQRTRSSLDCIESTWMWTHEEPLDMNEVYLFLCDEHSGKLSDEQKGFPSITLGERIVIPRDRFLQWMESEVDKKLKK